MYKWLLPNVNGIVHAAFMPRGSPDAVLQILRDSFIRVTEDEEYRAEEEKIFGLNLPVVSSKEGTATIDNMTNAPEHVRLFLKQYIKQGR